jgi:8-oxo-dGTP diphosphatase
VLQWLSEERGLPFVPPPVVAPVAPAN